MGSKRRHRWEHKPGHHERHNWWRVCRLCKMQERVTAGPNGGELVVYFAAGANPAKDDPVASGRTPPCSPSQAAPTRPITEREVGVVVITTVPVCLRCENDARWPPERPLFCEPLCAGRQAADDYECYRYCDKHGWWDPGEYGYHHGDDGPDCVECIDGGDRTLESCVAAGEHGVRLDKNDYCRYCGHYSGKNFPVPRAKG